MIDLYVGNLLEPLKGELLQGSASAKIQHAAAKPEEAVHRHTLVFDFPSSYNWSRFPFRDAAVVVTETPSRVLRQVSKGVGVIRVRKVESAYWRFIRFYRSQFDIPVIGVTGTCGKTTTTEMIKTILARKYRIQSTDDGKNSLSYNLPYLLNWEKQTEAAVYEMGVSHPGCIMNSCRYFRPKVGVILNIGVYHLLGCGTFERYLQAKAEMAEGIDPDGTLIINGDDANVAKIDLSRFPGKIVRVGMGERCSFRARDLRYADGGMTFTLEAEEQSLPMFVHGYGAHTVSNALAALAAVRAIGMDLKEAGEGLAAFRQVRSHLEFRKGPNGSTLIDDTWNCTPSSVASALRVLQATAKERGKVMVLGYMPQLGDNGKGEYAKAASRVLQAGVDRLIVIGEAQAVGRRAVQLGMDRGRVYFCETGDEAFRALRPFLNPRHLILLKFPFKYRLYKKQSFRWLMSTLLG